MRWRTFFHDRGEFRNYALFVVGTYTALRISDLLNLKWEDVYNEERGSFKTRIALTEKKTHKHKELALHEKASQALKDYYPYRQGDYIFSSSRSPDKPITRVQAWRIIRDAATAVGATGVISCHSMRKTWGYHAWVNGNISPIIIMDVYNHSDYNITKRYLGVTQDDLDNAYLSTNIL